MNTKSTRLPEVPKKHQRRNRSMASFHPLLDTGGLMDQLFLQESQD